ncbi:MAG: hypothetical protein K6G90_03965 [Clostridia bacterium]|nr:hypothetical protein [Clostridia bacterium]
MRDSKRCGFPARTFVLAALCLCLCFALSSCSPAASGTSYVQTPVTVLPSAARTEHHSPGTKRAVIAQSDYLSFEIDETTGCPIIKDDSTGRQFRALPVDENEYAAVLEISLLTENGLYILNSSDNSAVFGGVKITPAANGCSVTYTLSDSKSTADKLPEELAEGDIRATLTLDYSLAGQTLRVSSDISAAKTAPGARIISVTLLPYFGSSLRPADGDYILLPDNSGAILRSNTDLTEDELLFDVYGADPFVPVQGGARAYLPCFGVKSGTSAFAAVITEGDALSHIHANAATGSSPARAYASFDIIRTAADDAKGRLYTGSAYDGRIGMAFKFLSEDNANYSGMAIASREELIHMGYLPADLSSASGAIDMTVTTVGSYDGETFCSAENTQNLVSSLLGRGISRVSLYYRGALTGGLSQNELYSAGFRLSLGGSGKLKDLHEFMRSRSCPLYLGAEAILAVKGIRDSRAVYDIFGNRAYGAILDPLSGYPSGGARLSVRVGAAAAAQESQISPSLYPGTGTIRAGLASVSAVNEIFDSVTNEKYFKNSDGLLFSDLGRILSSYGDTDRQTAAAITGEMLTRFAETGTYSLTGANAYALAHAAAVTGLGFDTQYTESAAYEPVPFAEIILHGRIAYSGNPVDAAAPLYRFDMLQAIEYGALPSFMWVWSDKSAYSYTYYQQSDLMPVIAEYYSTANEILSDLAGRGIIRHERVLNSSDGGALTGVYKTSYSGGACVYVNYNPTPVTTADNVVVGAYDCVRIDR